MPFKKGKPKTGGRQPGVVNKTTMNGREAIAKFVDGNATRLNNWLDQIAIDSPRDAFNAFMSVVEYHIPKLARSEITGKDGATIDLTVRDGAITAARDIISSLTAARADSPSGPPQMDKQSKT